MALLDLPHKLLNAYRLRRLRRVVAAANALEAEVSKRSDAELRGSAAALRSRLSLGEDLDDLQPEAFALARETARRTIKERPFDVQMIGAGAMHRGWIAEMQTGEGKTLTATMPAFLNALSGRGVHVVTTNDYLAARDAEWMGGIYKALGLTVGCITHGMEDADRVAAYRADITYGTNKEFAFDYLRDQLRAHSVRPGRGEGVFERTAGAAGGRVMRVQREHNFAIVDEVDNILVDEARVPLIISDKEGAESPYGAAYAHARQVAQDFRSGHEYVMDQAKRSVYLTEMGVAEARGAEPRNCPPNRPFEHMVRQALQGEYLFQRDREYLVMDDKVGIVDEFTGRMLPDRSWSLGLHQAIETKEGVPVTEENRTLASVTFQRYFNLYTKLSGMTGTALEARREFRKVFKLAVTSIPTNKVMLRRKLPYRLYPTWEQKRQAILERVLELHEAGGPC